MLPRTVSAARDAASLCSGVKSGCRDSASRFSKATDCSPPSKALVASAMTPLISGLALLKAASRVLGISAVVIGSGGGGSPQPVIIMTNPQSSALVAARGRGVWNQPEEVQCMGSITGVLKRSDTGVPAVIHPLGDTGELDGRDVPRHPEGRTAPIVTVPFPQEIDPRIEGRQ